MGFAIRGSGPTLWERKDPKHFLWAFLERIGQSRTKLAIFSNAIDIKDYHANYVHSKVSHLLMEINNSAIFPLLLKLFCMLRHDISVAGNLAGMKDRSQ